MNNNQQPKPDSSWKAEFSLKLAIAAILPPAILWGISKIYPHTVLGSLIFSYIFIGFLLALFGLIFGISGLKSTKRRLAIIGIILSIIAIPIFVVLILIVFLLVASLVFGY